MTDKTTITCPACQEERSVVVEKNASEILCPACEEPIALDDQNSQTATSDTSPSGRENSPPLIPFKYEVAGYIIVTLIIFAMFALRANREDPINTSIDPAAPQNERLTPSVPISKQAAFWGDKHD